MTDIYRLETDILGIAIRVRDEFTIALSKLHLDADSPQLSRNTTGPDASAEVTMYIRREGEIVDAIEFHVHRAGVATATPEEIESWLRTTFADVLSRQRSQH